MITSEKKKVSITEEKNTSVICGDIDTPSNGEVLILRRTIQH